MDPIAHGTRHFVDPRSHRRRSVRPGKRRRNRRTLVGALLGAVTLLAAGVTIPALAAKSPIGAPCSADGHVTYTLNKAASPTPEQSDAYARITTAMDEALSWYNCFANLTKTINVYFDPSVSTAKGRSDGALRFGATDTMQKITAMHEISHTIGVGTTSAWQSLVRDGKYTGAKGLAEFREITGQPDGVINADRQHFWPYGLNQVSEVKTDDDLLYHVLIVDAMADDLGVR